MGYPDRVPCRTDSGDLERFRNPSNPMFAITAGKELRPVKAAAETHSWSALDSCQDSGWTAERSRRTTLSAPVELRGVGRCQKALPPWLVVPASI